MARTPRYPIPLPDAVARYSRRWFRLQAAAVVRRIVNPGGRERPAAPPNWLERAFWIAAFAAVALLGCWLFLSVDLMIAGLIALAVALLALLVSRLSRAALLWWLFRICVLTLLAMAARSTISATAQGRIFGLDVSFALGPPPGLEAYAAVIIVILIVWFAADRASG